MGPEEPIRVANRPVPNLTTDDGPVDRTGAVTRKRENRLTKQTNRLLDLALSRELNNRDIDQLWSADMRFSRYAVFCESFDSGIFPAIAATIIEPVNLNYER